MEGANYFPPWANTSIIGIAGSSGSGKTSLAMRIVSLSNLPWVIILSMVGNYLHYKFYVVLKASRTPFTKF